MKKSLKILISVIVVLIVIWGIIFFVDYSRCSNLKEPIFVIAGVTADDGGSGTYYGLGYKVKMQKSISAEYGVGLVKVEMYLFNQFIVGAIAETNYNDVNEDNETTEINDNSVNEGNVTTEEKQYEFVAKIIEAYDNSIVVEPEEGTNERKSSDKISMSINRPTSGINDFYVVGNKVKITYNGTIKESYPAQISATKIELAD